MLTGRIDALLGAIKSARSLSDKEQLLLSTLIEVKSETEQRLRDWTPPTVDRAPRAESAANIDSTRRLRP